MRAINYIATDLDDQVMETVCEQLNEQNKNIYVNPFTIASLFLISRNQRNKIINTLIKYGAYICIDCSCINEEIYEIYKLLKDSSNNSEYYTDSKSKVWSSSIWNHNVEDEVKECKTPSSFLPLVANNSQIRSEIFSIPISSQHKSTNIQVNLTCKRYEEMYHLLNDGTLVDDHKYSLWKTNNLNPFV